MTVSRFRTIIYIVAAIVSLAGLADATYLSVQALTGETLGCGGSPIVSGSWVVRTPDRRIPVALFGMLAYFGAFSFATFAAFGYARARTFLIPTIGAMFLGTLWLLYVQAFLLHAYCRYCLFSCGNHVSAGRAGDCSAARTRQIGLISRPLSCLAHSLALAHAL
jgi:uncharacterized membrane protein